MLTHLNSYSSVAIIFFTPLCPTRPLPQAGRQTRRALDGLQGINGILTTIDIVGRLGTGDGGVEEVAAQHDGVSAVQHEHAPPDGLGLLGLALAEVDAEEDDPLVRDGVPGAADAL